MTRTAAAPPTRRRELALLDPPGLYDPAPNGYSHVASVAGAGRWVFVAGQGGETLDGRLSPAFRAQVRQALANLLTALSAAGAAPADVVKLTVLVVDHDQARLRIFGEELARAFGGHRPACTLIPVPRLALDGMLFEIDAVAAPAGAAG
ncbi:RidA family protein [Luteimonas sp. RD2P54]|uniref:RidA family protein n=1 Tax=Luteimonas endophytica TaxID=3042023 RepID=A0ABT6JAT6_9GAMM|nr:RidA family protein [Luteimonas endophytica]MDH5823288.1 RidA family protein [Luteimonas endophytica]